MKSDRGIEGSDIGILSIFRRDAESFEVGQSRAELTKMKVVQREPKPRHDLEKH
jgi:hypothetical protein